MSCPHNFKFPIRRACQAMGTKERRSDKEGDRGRSRERRRSEKKSRSRDRRRRKNEADEKSRSHSSKAVLTPAAAPAPAASRETEKTSHGKTKKSEVDAAVADKDCGGDDHDKDSPKPTGHGSPSDSTVPSTAAQVPEPAKGPRANSPVAVKEESAADNNEDAKHSKHQCPVCGRTVGGGEAGSFQHRRSPFPLANWVWNNSKEDCSWQQCLTDGKNWSKLLYQQGSTGPRSNSEKLPAQKRQSPPPPVRADPKRDQDRRRDQGPDPDPDSGASGSGKSSLLLQMWQTTLRELK